MGCIVDINVRIPTYGNAMTSVENVNGEEV
jgi:hypothetical protein